MPYILANFFQKFFTTVPPYEIKFMSAAPPTLFRFYKTNPAAKRKALSKNPTVIREPREKLTDAEKWLPPVSWLMAEKSRTKCN